MSINVKRTTTILKPDQSRVLLRSFNPGDPQRVGRIIARIMSLPEDQVGPLLDEVSAEFSQRHQQIRKLFLERFEQVRELLLTDEKLSEAKTTIDRLLFPGRILFRIRGALQSLHCPAPRSNWPATWRFAVRSQLAGHGGGTRFLNHLQDRRHPPRSSDRGINPRRFPHRAAANYEAV